MYSDRDSLHLLEFCLVAIHALHFLYSLQLPQDIDFKMRIQDFCDLFDTEYPICQSMSLCIPFEQVLYTSLKAGRIHVYEWFSNSY